MKYLALAALFFSPVTFAAARPNNWTCEVARTENLSGKKSEVKVSLQEPLLTLIEYKKEDEVTYRPVSEKLIDEEVISQWRAPKSQCKIDIEARNNEAMDSYSFDFNCTGIVGNFSLNFRNSSGLYVETRPEQNIKRTIALENCRALAIQ
jgi:hypothetical protein